MKEVHHPDGRVELEDEAPLAQSPLYNHDLAPVRARASYGVYGSNLPAVIRALVACGWFGIQAWIGGQALHTFLRVLWPKWATLLGGPLDGVRLSLGKWTVLSLAGTTPTQQLS